MTRNSLDLAMNGIIGNGGELNTDMTLLEEELRGRFSK